MSSWTTTLKNKFTRGKTFEFDKDLTLDYGDLEVETTETGRTYLTPQGEKYPSITTVLSVLDTGFLEQWRAAVGDKEADRVSRIAADRGSTVHDLAEKYVGNDENVIKGTEMPHILANFRSLQRELDAHVGKVFVQETPLYSDVLRVAGRVDLVAEWDGIPSIVDFKTSNRIKSKKDIVSYFLQTCFYAIAFEERTGIRINQIVIIIVVNELRNALVFVEDRSNWEKELKETINEHTSRRNKEDRSDS